MAEIKDPENTIVMETTKGKVVIELLPDLAPNHVARIKELARENFYDGIVFHRVIDGFMAQTGDPTGTGMGGSDKPDLKAEFSNMSHVRGTCSMARVRRTRIRPTASSSSASTTPASSTSQYTVWGQVIEGMDAIDKIKRGEPGRDPDSDRHHARRRRRLIFARAFIDATRRRCIRRCASTFSISSCRMSASRCGRPSPRDAAKLLDRASRANRRRIAS
jgi:cyclophilin family peptidyl-prolyl cis-trans isomerase